MSGNFNNVQNEDVDYHINHCNDNNKKSNEGCMYIQMIMNDEVYKVIVDEMFIEQFLMNIESKSYQEK